MKVNVHQLTSAICTDYTNLLMKYSTEYGSFKCISHSMSARLQKTCELAIQGRLYTSGANYALLKGGGG